jgi:hypothetical protein
MDRHAADRTGKRLARKAGITKRISPHSLRHSFITAALDAGVPLRDVQEAASHADPRTTMRYDRGRGSLDRHATYIVANLPRRIQPLAQPVTGGALPPSRGDVGPPLPGRRGARRLTSSCQPYNRWRDVDAAP